MVNLNDIHSLSEFQRNAKQFVAQAKETKTPLVLTVNGKAEVVIQDAGAYQELLDRLEQLETVAGIRQSLEEFNRGEGLSLDEAFTQLREKHGL